MGHTPGQSLVGSDRKQRRARSRSHPRAVGDGGIQAVSGPEVLGKITRRLGPIIVIAYFIAYLDRTNISIAALTMNPDLGISHAEYGLAAGLFFVGYILCEVPSNLIMRRVGARIWIARIMITWGIMAAATAAVDGAITLYIMRILLGVAEAGFFPGMILYLTYWYPATERARSISNFMIAIPLSTVIGAPLGGLLLSLDGVAGLHGWQWLFLVEAIPALLVGVLILRILPSRPAEAKWLTRAEKIWVERAVADNPADAARHRGVSTASLIFRVHTAKLAMVYFAAAFGLYGIGFWLPQLVKDNLSISSNFEVSVLAAIPYLMGAAAMLWWSRRCDHRGQHRRYTGIPLMIGGVALAASALLTGLPWLGYAGMCVCVTSLMAMLPSAWTLPGSVLPGKAAGVGIAAINTFAASAGFFAPYWLGWSDEAFGSSAWGLVGIGLVMLLGGLLAVTMRDDPAQTA